MACGGDTDAASARTADEPARAADGPVQVRLVSDDPAVRQRLTPPQILGYYPAGLGEREAFTRRVTLSDEAREAGTSHVNVGFLRPPRMDQGINIAVTDWIDRPESGPARESSELVTGERLSPYKAGEVSDVRTLEGGVGQSYVMEDGMATLHVLLAERFAVILRADEPTTTAEDLWAAYDASGIARIAGAGVYGDATPEPPDWAAEPIAEWSPPEAEPDTPTEPAASSTPLASCDVLLPVEEVRRVCAIPELRAKSTPFEQEGKNCNRVYNRVRELSGLTFIVSRFSNEGVARSAQQASMDFEDQLDRRDVAGLGDAATRVTQDFPDLRDQTHYLTVASGVDLIEFRTGNLSVERGQQVCTLDQIETLAQGVVARLEAGSP
ncbi:MAG: hypothetical protein Rubg2KO_06580 [Rubricoccaceae bacterium]